MSAGGVVPIEDQLRALVRDVPDFPEPGVLFRDITPLLADSGGYAAMIDALAQRWAAESIDKVVGIEARGFILAAPVAYRLGAGFIPVRKAGKLPAATHRVSYSLEYGEATVEIHRDAFLAGDRVLVVDDVLATGGTAAATAGLIRAAGGQAVGMSVLVELESLGGRKVLSDAAGELDLHALLTY